MPMPSSRTIIHVEAGATAEQILAMHPTQYVGSYTSKPGGVNEQYQTLMLLI
jgi:hypothetical protein